MILFNFGTKRQFLVPRGEKMRLAKCINNHADFGFRALGNGGGVTVLKVRLKDHSPVGLILGMSGAVG